MATTKLGNTKSASRAINYAEKRAEVKNGHHCDIHYAKSQMKATRSMVGKDDGVQAHTIIQSFKPEETTPDQANQIGMDLAKEVAKDHQVAVYTHADTDHIHNHIIVNAVHLETGKKYQSNAEQRHLIKDKNDEICRHYGLSTVQEKQAEVRHTLTEQELLKKGKSSWKEHIRQSVDQGIQETNDWNSFTKQMAMKYNVETKLRGNTLSFKPADRERFVRASKLGANYEKEAIERGLRGKTRTKGIDWAEYERTNDDQDTNLRGRTSKRADSTTYRPISSKYRAEQQQRQREHEERLKREREKQQQAKRANKRAREQSKGLSR